MPVAAFAQTWTQVPGAGGKGSFVNALAAISGDDIWAVGGNSRPESLIEHWDGAAWTEVTHREFGVSRQLYGIAIGSPKFIWAVGTDGSNPLIEHYNGRKWIEVASPSVGQYDTLYGVTTISTRDAWAVGYSLSPFAYFILHWDGGAWSRISGPSVASGSALLAIKGFASDNVWAVGYQGYKASTNAASTLVLHWDGAAWSEIPAPNLDIANYLAGIDGVAPNDLWAVGNYGNGADITNSLALHWDGTAWTQVPTPAGNQQQLANVKAASANDVWAAGSSMFQPLTEHWNGTSWQIIPTPPVKDQHGLLFGLTIADGTPWTAGYEGGAKIDDLFLKLTSGSGSAGR